MTLPRLDESDGDLYFLPLGGADEIGMNVNLYGYAGHWLMVDLGMTFGDDSTPGIDLILPDISAVEDSRDRLVGLLITHGHEDHIGAIPYLWDRLGCPIWCTPFVASLVRRKLGDAGLLDKVPLNEVPVSGNFVVGPFEIELIPITHSIPEASAIALRCGAGTVVHSGDWKFDPTPFVGRTTDLAALRAVGAEGVLALVGDSTNVFVPGRSASEAEVRMALSELFAQYDGRGRIAVSCFASNVARLESIAVAAAANDRQTTLVGRSLWRMHDAAHENGYLLDGPTFVAEEEAGYLPEDRIVMICTGSQGEPRAALSRIADGAHPHVSLGSGDVCVFSSRQIPGNERAIARVQNRLATRGVEIVTTEDQPAIHASGHAARDEITEMYQILRPRIAVPVHGDARHLREHARLAASCQVPETVVPSNGSLIRLSSGRSEVVDWIDGAGPLAVDDGQLLALGSEALRDRRRMLHNGMVNVTLVADGRGLLKADPVVSLIGITDDEDTRDIARDLVAAIEEGVQLMAAAVRNQDDGLADGVRRIARRLLRTELGKRPVVDVHVVRVRD